jgi:hypothetical protein
VTTPEIPVVLILDLADKNPIVDSMVLDHVPAGDSAPTILRATDFGATRTRSGTPIDWPGTRTGRGCERSCARTPTSTRRGKPRSPQRRR